MQLYDTLIDLLAAARDRDRHIRFIEGEHDESSVSFAELWDRAIALLGSLQSRGMQQGDELIIFSKSNESFVVAFWAAILGGNSGDAGSSQPETDMGEGPRCVAEEHEWLLHVTGRQKKETPLSCPGA